MDRGTAIGLGLAMISILGAAVVEAGNIQQNDIRIDGHTDSTPIDSPRYPTNWELSVAWRSRAI